MDPKRSMPHSASDANRPKTSVENALSSADDLRLPRRIGEALKDAHQGELDVRFGDNEYSVQVDWKRW